MYRPSRLDLPKSGTIEYAFVRSSTAACFKFFYLSFEYFVGVHSPKPIYTKIYLISWFFFYTGILKGLFRETPLDISNKGMVTRRDFHYQHHLLILRRTAFMYANRQIGLQKMRELYVFCLKGVWCLPNRLGRRLAQHFADFFIK